MPDASEPQPVYFSLSLRLDHHPGSQRGATVASSRETPLVAILLISLALNVAQYVRYQAPPASIVASHSRAHRSRVANADDAVLSLRGQLAHCHDQLNATRSAPSEQSVQCLARLQQAELSIAQHLERLHGCERALVASQYARPSGSR